MVKQINIRNIPVRRADGIDIFIPSALVFKNTFENFTRDSLRRAEFVSVSITEIIPGRRGNSYLSPYSISGGILGEPSPSVEILNFSPNYVELQVLFWMNTFSKHSSLPEIRTQAMDESRSILLQHGFIPSSEVSTAVEVTNNNKMQ